MLNFTEKQANNEYTKLIVKTMWYNEVKDICKICSDEVISQEQLWIDSTKKGSSAFWKNVKQEIEKL